ncbi:DNA-directed RNA polymerase III subunit RPC10 [Dionaea muscipula]
MDEATLEKRKVGFEKEIPLAAALSGRAFGSESSFGMDFCSTCGKLLQYDKTKKEEAPKPNKERKVTCPKCSHDKPEYHEIQIESADEPNATFYRCPECSHEWPHEDA